LYPYAFRLSLLLTLNPLKTTERAIVHEDFTTGQTSNYRFTRIRVMFPNGFDVCDSVIAVQGNMSGVTIRKFGSNVTRQLRFYKAGSTTSAGVTIRKFGSNVTRQLRFYKAGSTTSAVRGITEPTIPVQKVQRPIPRTGSLHMHASCGCFQSSDFALQT